MRSLALAVLAAACGSSHGAQPDAGAADSGVPVVATGTQLVDHARSSGGVKRGYVAYYDTNDAGHTVAEIIPIGGGTATPIAASTGSGKLDIEFEFATVFVPARRS